MPDDWTRGEVEAIVADYFSMVQSELAGQNYSKTAHRTALAPELNGRSKGSIEFKHGNISAVLAKRRLRSIRGYKPRGNFQELLQEAVLEYLAARPDLSSRLVLAGDS